MRYPAVFSLPFALVFSLITTALPGEAYAGIYNANSEVTYKEYWVPANQYTSSNCQPNTTQNPEFSGYKAIQPGPDCVADLIVHIPDNISNAKSAEIYVDLWRNRESHVAKITVGASTYRPDVGADWSRSPYVHQINLNDIVQGDNTIEFSAIDPGGQPYLVRDVAIRVYFDSSHQISDGSGNPISAPDGALADIGGNLPGAGGTLTSATNSIPISATVGSPADVAYVEFYADYYGYDEDGGGDFTDWHGMKVSSIAPGPAAIAGNVGTDDTANGSDYSVNWDTQLVSSQDNVRFKIRIVGTNGAVREAAGGVSAPFKLSRSDYVNDYFVDRFTDSGVPTSTPKDYAIYLPDDIGDVTKAYLIGYYAWKPQISLNGNTSYAASSDWGISVKDVTNQIKAGKNVVQIAYSGTSETYVEKPGPAIVLVRSDHKGAPATGAFVSDDFDAAALDTLRWSIVDPPGDSAVHLDNGELKMSVTAGGVAKDIWTDGYLAPRVVQASADTDFDIEMKFDSAVTQRYQQQGIIIQENTNEFLRFVHFNDGDPGKDKLFAATFKEGDPTIKLWGLKIAHAVPMYLRVRRQGDQWTFYYSYDGKGWTQATQFNYALTVRAVGLYGGNAGDPPPAFTARVDYIHENDLSAPITVQPDPTSSGASGGGGGGGGGCTLASGRNDGVDPTLPLLALIAGLYLLGRARRRKH